LRELPIVTDLPASIVREIGRVVVLHSYLEHVLGRIIYDILDIDPKIGRTVIREPRGGEVFDMIRDLAQIKGLELSDEYNAIREGIEAAKTQRDQVGHGVWLRDRDTGHLFLRIIKGSWQPKSKMRGKIKRRISPEGQEYGTPELRSTIELIEETIEAVNRLHDDLKSALRSLPGKRARQSAQPSPRQVSSDNKRSAEKS
jgi:hypothetical protein